VASDATQYLIDISARLQGGESAAAGLASIGERMRAAGAGASDLEAALAHARSALDEAKASAAGAASALAAGEASYSAAETAADRAAKAYERVSAAAEAQKGKVAAALDAGDLKGAERASAKLSALMARQDEARQRAEDTADALKSEAQSLSELQDAASAASDAEKELEAATSDLESSAEAAAKSEADVTRAAEGSGKVNELGEAFGRLGGPLGALGQKAVGLYNGLGKLQGSLGASTGLAVGATVAVVALAAAMLYGLAATLRWAVGLADASRSASLTVAAVEATSASLSGLSGILPGVQSATGLAQDELVGLAQQLDAAGVSASDMPAALRAVATAEAALGKGGAAKFVEQLKSGKASASELAAEVDSKLGGIVAKRMLGLDAQAAKLTRNVGQIFGGLDIEGTLVGLDKIGGLLDADSASGQAIKLIFDKLFQPLLDSSSTVFPAVEGFILGFEIGVLKAYIAAKPLLKIFSAIGGGGSDVEGTAKAMENLGQTIGIVAAVAGAVLYALAWPFIKIAEGIGAAVKLAGLLGSAIQSGIGAAVSWLEGLSLAQIGSDLIQGLADGITGGAAAVVAAAVGVASSAISAVEKVLKIGSPSKVFHEIGGYTAEGFAGGVEAGSDSAQTALETMVSPPDVASPAPARAAGPSINLAGASFTFNGVENAEQAEGRFAALLTRIVEGDALQLGAVPA